VQRVRNKFLFAPCSRAQFRRGTTWRIVISALKSHCSVIWKPHVITNSGLKKNCMSRKLTSPAIAQWVSHYIFFYILIIISCGKSVIFNLQPFTATKKNRNGTPKARFCIISWVKWRLTCDVRVWLSSVVCDQVPLPRLFFAKMAAIEVASGVAVGGNHHGRFDLHLRKYPPKLIRIYRVTFRLLDYTDIWMQAYVCFACRFICWNAQHR
jgi:hypothetical protein